MLGKLLKYEFRATGRVFLPFFGALLVVSVISRILGSFGGANGMAQAGTGAPYIIGMVISIILMVTVFVVAFVLMIQRFSKNLIGDEGYLMFTLPVRTDSLIFSKLIVSAVWFIACLVIVLISIAIMALTDIGSLFNDIGQVLSQIFTGGAGDVVVTLQAVILVVLALFTSVLSIYMCISLSMLFNRRRGLISVGFFMLYIIVIQIIGTIGVAILQTDLPDILFGWVSDMSMTGATNMALLGMNLLTVIWGGALYFVTRYMLSRRLNLE